MTNESKVELVFPVKFLSDVRHLKRKYRRVESDLQSLYNQLLRAETPGDRIQGVEP